MSNLDIGYVMISRSVFTHWTYNEKIFDRWHAFFDLIARANFEPRKMLFDAHLINVERGQHMTSILKLSKRWGWSRTKVTTFLNNLEKDGMIARLSDTKSTLITICNYNKYQTPLNYKKQLINMSQTSPEHERDINNNINHSNKSIKIGDPYSDPLIQKILDIPFLNKSSDKLTKLLSLYEQIIIIRASHIGDHEVYNVLKDFTDINSMRAALTRLYNV